MVNIYWTRLQLWRWGRAVKECGIGFPSMSAHEQIRSGVGVMAIERQLPDDLEAVNNAVTMAPIDYKILLIEHYTKEGTAEQHAARIGIKRSSYFDRKKAAEKHISEKI